MPRIIKPAKGSFTTADITVDSSGRVIAASSGAGGDGSYVPRLIKNGPASGNITHPSNASKFYAYGFGGGGGGGRPAAPNANGAAGRGGVGGFGFFSGNITGGATLAYAVGAGGNAGVNQEQPGGAGGATTVTNLLTVNGGGGGSGASSNNQAPDGSAGSSPGATITLPSQTYLAGGNVGKSGPIQDAGGVGHLTFFDDGGQ
jgi:hypothetical protein|tara:strand:- start:1851 stop:2456 length:606 start_codon:yes stop_codon:yes gene_type:complete